MIKKRKGFGWIVAAVMSASIVIGGGGAFAAPVSAFSGEAIPFVVDPGEHRSSLNAYVSTVLKTWTDSNNSSFVDYGDELVATITVKNTSNKIFTNVDLSSLGLELDRVHMSSNLKPGESVSIDVNYSVKEFFNGDTGSIVFGVNVSDATQIEMTHFGSLEYATKRAAEAADETPVGSGVIEDGRIIDRQAGYQKIASGTMDSSSEMTVIYDSATDTYFSKSEVSFDALRALGYKVSTDVDGMVFSADDRVVSVVRISNNSSDDVVFSDNMPDNKLELVSENITNAIVKPGEKKSFVIEYKINQYLVDYGFTSILDYDIEKTPLTVDGGYISFSGKLKDSWGSISTPSNTLSFGENVNSKADLTVDYGVSADSNRTSNAVAFVTKKNGSYKIDKNLEFGKRYQFTVEGLENDPAVNGIEEDGYVVMKGNVFSVASAYPETAVSYAGIVPPVDPPVIPPVDPPVVPPVIPPVDPPVVPPVDPPVKPPVDTPVKPPTKKKTPPPVVDVPTGNVVGDDSEVYTILLASGLILVVLASTGAVIATRRKN